MTIWPSLQAAFIETLSKDSIAVSVYLINGIKVSGYITAHDHHVITIKNTVTQLLYKKAISTIVPTCLIPVEEFA